MELNLKSIRIEEESTFALKEVSSSERFPVAFHEKKK